MRLSQGDCLIGGVLDITIVGISTALHWNRAPERIPCHAIEVAVVVNASQRVLGRDGVIDSGIAILSVVVIRGVDLEVVVPAIIKAGKLGAGKKFCKIFFPAWLTSLAGMMFPGNCWA